MSDIRCPFDIHLHGKEDKNIQHFDSDWDHLAGLDQEIQSFL